MKLLTNEIDLQLRTGAPQITKKLLESYPSIFLEGTALLLMKSAANNEWNWGTFQWIEDEMLEGT